jgi:hypothetical protein
MVSTPASRWWLNGQRGPTRVTRQLATFGALLLAVGCGGSPRDEGLPSTVPNPNSTLGYNLDFPGDWTNLPPFIDLMKNSRAPRGNCTDDDPGCDAARHLDLDANGWPKSLRYRDNPERSYESIEIGINSSNDRPDIGKRFAITWEGSGSIALTNGDDIDVDEARRRIEFTLETDDTFLLLTEIDPNGTGSYLRNIRVFRTDLEPLLRAGEIFNPEMLEYLAPFRSLRFMDWMQTNAWGQCSGGLTPGAECYAVTEDDCGAGGRCLMPGRWDERPTVDGPSYLSTSQYLDVSAPELGTRMGGYAIETMVALANRLPADPHFNIPADYDDEYVQGFAEYLRDNLAPGLTASIEYSNEVWNWDFPQAQYANAIAQEMWPGEGSAWMQYAAGRTHTACGIIKRVFAGQEERIRCLISPQTGYRGLAEAVLDCPLWAAEHQSGPCSGNADAVNITGYFAGCLVNNEDVILDWLEGGMQSALDLGFEQLEHGTLIESCSGEEEDNLDLTIDNYDYFSGLAQTRGLGLYVYESGTHFHYAGEGAADFFVEMTRDERMYDLYLKNFSGFAAAGGDIMNVWGWVAPRDMWANSDSVLDREHPKYRAISDFVAERSR